MITPLICTSILPLTLSVSDGYLLLPQSLSCGGGKHCCCLAVAVVHQVAEDNVMETALPRPLAVTDWECYYRLTYLLLHLLQQLQRTLCHKQYHKQYGYRGPCVINSIINSMDLM